MYLQQCSNLNGIIDFYNKLKNDHRENIRELLNLELFKTLKTNLDTICCDNGVDFVPEYLYEQVNIQQ